MCVLGLPGPQLPDTPDWLDEVIALLREGAGLDVSRYKPGTLMRRTERRAAMMGFHG